MTNAKSTTKRKSNILADHQKLGAKFIPPMLQLGPWEDVSWMGTIVPEFIWIGLLNQVHGLREGADLALSLARIATIATGIDAKEFKKKFGKGPKQWFAASTAYQSLIEGQKANIVDRLKSLNQLEALCFALAPLGAFYPACPLNFLFQGKLPEGNKDDFEQFKNLLPVFFDKYTNEATFMVGTAIYIAFCTNKLRIMVSDDRKAKDDPILAKFPELSQYPTTEESKAIAAAARASAYSILDKSSSEWPDYFWNRGLELAPCN